MTLVGLAMVLFLHPTGFHHRTRGLHLAYAISTTAVITMISLYGMAVFKSKQLSMLLVVTLLGIYSFLFVTMQLAD